MDARREQVYTGLYEFKDDVLNVLKEATAEPIEETVERVNSYGRHVIFLGDGVSVFKEKILSLIKVPVTFSDAAKCMQSAASVATLGLKLFKEGKAVPASEHVPDYLRLSQAEREKAEKENGGKNEA
jgi:tRNA threonylcarbamoyladenosine biosynthesis protein TsaB